MRNLSIVLTVTLTTLLSCVEPNEENHEYILFNSITTELLVRDMIETNQGLIQLLDSLNLDDRPKIEFVRNQSIEEIDDLLRDLIDFCGGVNPETRELMNPMEREKITIFFIQMEKGDELKKSSNKIIKFIHQYDKDIKNIAQDGQEIAVFRNTKWSKMNFAELHFRDITLVGALNAINLYKAKVVQAENNFLISLLKK